MQNTTTIENAKTVGVSPKLLADLFASVAGFALLKYGVDLDATVSAAVGKIIGTIAGAIAGPGSVEVDASASARA